MKQNNPKSTPKTENGYSSFIMIRFSEIAIKGSKTRRWLTKRLVTHIEYVLRLYGISEYKVINDYSRIFVESSQLLETEKFIAHLVPGVSSLSIVRSCSSNLEEIKECVKEFFFQNFKEGMSFAVRARRTGKHPFSSVELGAIIGEYILENNVNKKLKVNLDKPEYTLQVEVRDNSAYIFDSISKGIGGLPVESQGRVLVIVSNEDEDISNILHLYKRGGITYVYSIENQENISDEILQLFAKMLDLQPKLKNKENRLFLPTNEFNISHMLGFYKENHFLAMTMTKAFFNKISSEIPTSIPIFVPHLAVDVDKHEIEDFLSVLIN